MLSPTQRTLKVLKDNGNTSQIVEHFNYHAGKFGIRQDLLGFGDIITLSPKNKTITLIQCTAAGGSARIKKIKTECLDKARLWLECSGGIEVWSWVKRKAGVVCNVTKLTLDDFPEVEKTVNNQDWSKFQ